MEYRLDLRTVENLEELHRMLSDELELPKYYGKNLDGLYDILSAGSRDMTIQVLDDKKEDALFQSYIDRLKKMLTDLENECENIFVEWIGEEDLEEEV